MRSVHILPGAICDMYNHLLRQILPPGQSINIAYYHERNCKAIFTSFDASSSTSITLLDLNISFAEGFMRVLYKSCALTKAAPLPQLGTLNGYCQTKWQQSHCLLLP
uniref:Uncharacterized protein n=1 Tax=Arundo donax TaxID=35708 RepID=A0A0A9ADV6_ARUDO